MEVKIVLGHTFGDEGKGVTVQWLCKKAIEEGKRPVVVRFSGGPQAAHTIVNNGVEHICSSFGSGVLLGVPTVLYPNTYVDPICLMNEYRVLKEKGVEPEVSFCDNRIITPYDVLAGQRNKKVRSDGTCGRGLFATFDRCNSHGFNRTLFYRVHTPKFYLNTALKYHGVERHDEYDTLFSDAYNEMVSIFPERKNIWDCDVLIFEGSQGLLLDMNCGLFPHVTPSMVGLNGVPKTWLKNAEVYLVTRTYTTRHGNGYTPVFDHGLDLSGKHETNIRNEYQGEFKTGALEIPLLNRAYERHCIDNYVAKYGIKLNLVITHMDVVGDVFTYYGDSLRKCVVNGNPLAVAECITENLTYKPDNLYYNDSVASQLKKI